VTNRLSELALKQVTGLAEYMIRAMNDNRWSDAWLASRELYGTIGHVLADRYGADQVIKRDMEAKEKMRALWHFALAPVLENAEKVREELERGET